MSAEAERLFSSAKLVISMLCKILGYIIINTLESVLRPSIAPGSIESSKSDVGITDTGAMRDLEVQALRLESGIALYVHRVRGIGL